MQLIKYYTYFIRVNMDYTMCKFNMKDLSILISGIRWYILHIFESIDIISSKCTLTSLDELSWTCYLISVVLTAKQNSFSANLQQIYKKHLIIKVKI